MADSLWNGGEQRFTNQSEIRRDAVTKRSGTLILKIGHRQIKKVAEKIFAQAIQSRLTGTNEALNAEIANGCLQEERGNQFQDDFVGFREDLCWWDGVLHGVYRISDEFLKIIRESERESSGQE